MIVKEDPCAWMEISEQSGNRDDRRTKNILSYYLWDLFSVGKRGRKTGGKWNNEG
jgi:hypothetical protein